MITKYTFDPPIVKQAGDTFKRVGHWFEQWRGTSLVHRWDLNKTPQSDLDGFDNFGTEISFLYMEKPMAGVNVSLTAVEENQTTGLIRFKYSNGSSSDYNSWGDVGALADSIDAQQATAEEILAARTYRMSPDGSNKETQVGASCSVNLNASIPFVYTEAE